MTNCIAWCGMSGDEVRMRLALTGKGGSGKTALTALIARAFAEKGHMVLAVDLDVNPGLAVSFGVSLDDELMFDRAIEERASAAYGWALAEHLTAAEAVRRCGIQVTPRIVYLGFGNIGHADHRMRSYITAARQVADGFDEPGWVVVVDLGAGPTAIFEGHARAASLAVVLAEPTAAGMLGAERLLAVLQHDGTPAVLVTNEAHPRGDLNEIAGPDQFWAVPFDPELARLERTGSLSTLAGHSSALAAVRELATKIEGRSDPERHVAVDSSLASGNSLR